MIIRSPDGDGLPRPPLPLTVSAVVFLGFVGLMFLELLIAVALQPSGFSGFGFAGGLCFTPILLLFAAVFWKSTFRRSQEASEAASVLYLLAAGLTFIVGLGLVFDVATRGAPAVTLSALAVMAGAFSWLVLCGFLSMRWAADLKAYRQAQPPDPPPHARDRRDGE